ncbi:MAG: glycosyltransferase family 2 protein [Candidatus Liptonbacteria bacterium]|nr:glycosyltransferase family 2 protein [Candidatus Liptonbacteria bacterium]
MPTRSPAAISFVIPAHNEEMSVSACIASIKAELARTPVPAEIIVVNNASTDGTKAVALEHPGVTVVDEPVKGLPRARHAGFRKATGELIANIDADTRLPARWLEKTLREFEKSPKLVALSGPYIYYDLPRRVRAAIAAFYGLAYFLYALNRYVLRVGSLIQGGNFVARRRALEAIGGYDTNILFYGEDTDIARRLHKIGPVKFTLSFPVYSSGRRLAREGVVAIGLRYTVNYFWVTFLKKPFTTAAPKDVSGAPAAKN